ncbi:MULTISPECIES: glycosyltransferase [unclassified Azospirillum]|uniref:glycosyltransferase family 2 protein n=1 Tax=unclassified Azospirillum TaxID=2630922 RepID=UPI00165FF3AA|nr:MULTISPECIES: glycosyltransferase [unclassified Azospirillum]MDR6775142.1 GT2 family glycosyltransferase [Azospirillum sp. BE72]
MNYKLPAGVPRWQLPLTLPPSYSIEQHLYSAADLTVIIPVKDDPAGLSETLYALNELHAGVRPARVIVVDDGSSDAGLGASAEVRKASEAGLVVEACVQGVNRGPAAARNRGAELASTQWLWFLDAGVRPDTDYLEAITDHGHVCPAVAWTGPITSDPTGLFASYYTAQSTLSPPAQPDGQLDGFVTASVVINRAAFEAVGGFDERFRRAACEDLDLGLRLRPHGKIRYAADLLVRHRFREDEQDFRRRFRRYGFGFFQFGAKWQQNMEPWPVVARIDDPVHRQLAGMQYEELWNGWREAQAVDEAAKSEGAGLLS